MKPSCFFIGTSWADSAVSLHFRALARELTERGHRVVLLVDHQMHDVEDHDGNPAIYTWPSYRPVKWRDSLFLHSLIRKYKPECLVATFGSTNVMLTTGWLARVPHRVAWYLTLTEAIDIDSTMNRWKVKLLRLRKRLVYRMATKIIPNSHAGSVDVQQVFGVPAEKCHVAYLSLPDPLSGTEWDAARQSSFRPVCVGRLHPTKGQDILIQAIARLKNRIPDVHVEFVGDGPCRSELAALAEELQVSDRCTFSGRLPHDEVLRRMASSPVTVAPSRSECFGLVNLESLAVGTPVVACNVGGIGEIFRDGVEGFLVAPDDDQALAERLCTVLTDDALRKRMSASARDRFQSFEQKKVVSEHATWLEEMLENSPKRNSQALISP